MVFERHRVIGAFARMSYRQALDKVARLLTQLNHESREALLSVPGIGPKTADKILALRQTCVKDGRLVGALDIGSVFGPGGVTKLTGTKDAPSVIKYAALCTKLFHSNGRDFQTPTSILSLDLGIHNSAYVLIDNSYMIREWKKSELGMPSPYNPGTCFQEVEKSLKNFPSADVYIIEEQHSRYRLNKGVLNRSVQLRTLEAMVYAVCQLSKQASVYTLPPKGVARYFEISNKTSAVKKRLGVKYVMELLDKETPKLTPLGERLTIPTELLEYFNREKKKDDLSDCLLQAVAILDWCHMTQRLHVEE